MGKAEESAFSDLYAKDKDGKHVVTSQELNALIYNEERRTRYRRNSHSKSTDSDPEFKAKLEKVKADRDRR